MGFRGSRVQIPPSRLVNESALQRLAIHVAADYALLGERGKAFEWLSRAVREREGYLIWLKVDDRFEALRSDPRFRVLLHRIGLGS